MKFDVSKKVTEAGMILGALGVIGFVGIVWLMIYGNLDGNLGFTRLSANIVNESGVGYALDGVEFTLSNFSRAGFVSLVVTEIINGTDEALIPSSNYTYDGTAGTVNRTLMATVIYADVNVSYTVTYKGTGEIKADGVITNVTGGFGTFFGFSNTFFTIAAIVLLIFMLVGLLAIVVYIVQMQNQKKSSGYSGY